MRLYVYQRQGEEPSNTALPALADRLRGERGTTAFGACCHLVGLSGGAKMVGKPNDYNDVTGFGRLAKDLDESDREDDPEPPSDVAEDRPDSSRQEGEAPES